MKAVCSCGLLWVSLAVATAAFAPPCDRDDWPSECAAGAPPAFINFETAPVHPLDLSPDGQLLAVANLPAARIELLEVSTGRPEPWLRVPVGLDPVSVRFRNNTELWVANFISSSVSIVAPGSGRVMATLATPPGPADIVFAGTPVRAFVSCARANVIHVIDPVTRMALTNVAIDGDRPKALAASPDGRRIYCAIFESGNASTILGARLTPVNVPPAPSVVDFPGGPYGGQNPPPNRGAGFFPAINPLLLSNGPLPRVSHIVKKNTSGRWQDDNGGDWTEFVSGTQAGLSGRAVGWDMPDHDLAILDTTSLKVSYVNGLMNICMAVGVNPSSGRVLVVGTDALNERRFEPNLQGTFVRVQAAVVEPLAGTKIVRDLNPHLDYTMPRIPQSERDLSVGDPRAIVWNTEGTVAYVAGMGSRNIVALDATGSRLLPHPIEVGEGPCGLALDETVQRLYVYERFSSTLVALDTETDAIVSTVRLFDPTPRRIRDGRKHFYDTRRNSGLGQASCASCHVDGRFDRLAWDLGEPQGEDIGAIHSMKGPMVTQTLQDILARGIDILHWRGDRIGLEAFNQTFMALLGRETLLSETEMVEFREFLAPFYFPPNYYRNFDNTLATNVALPPGLYGAHSNGLSGAALKVGDARRGRSLSSDCRLCHPMFRGGGSSMTPLDLARSGSFHFKPAQLRSLPDKLGMDLSRTNSRAGFGFLHDGRVDSLVRVLVDGFQIDDEREQADLIAYLLSFCGSGEVSDRDDDSKFPSLDVPAAVGRQLTLTNAQAPELLDQMVAQAERSEEGVDLVARGAQLGLNRGWYYDRRSRRFQSDRQAEALNLPGLLQLAAPEAPLTFTVTTRGSGQRLGIDRDGDGYYDRTEVEAGLDPDDALSHGEPVPKAFYAEEWLERTQLGTPGTPLYLAPGVPFEASLASRVFDRELFYSLDGEVPEGARLDPVSGQFSWPSAESGQWRFFVRAMETQWPYFNDVAALELKVVSWRLRLERKDEGTFLFLDGLPDGRYRVERKRSWTDPDWTYVGTMQLQFIGLAFPLFGNLEGFYRVALEP